MSRKTIRTQTIYGAVKIKATARKWLVNRQEDDYWVVTHVPTGLKFPGYFFSKGDAIAASKLARRLFPYPLSSGVIPTENHWIEVLKGHRLMFLN